MEIELVESQVWIRIWIISHKVNDEQVRIVDCELTAGVDRMECSILVFDLHTLDMGIRLRGADMNSTGAAAMAIQVVLISIQTDRSSSDQVVVNGDHHAGQVLPLRAAHGQRECVG